MKSKIWIDIDEQNNPVIKVEYNQTDDVRDKLISRFFADYHPSDEYDGEQVYHLAVKVVSGDYVNDICKSFKAEIFPVHEIEVDIEELLRVENSCQDANEQAREYMNSINNGLTV